MPSVEESLTQNTALKSTLDAGVEQISLNQTITFTLYKRVVLPLDGFVFWVRADILSPSALIGAPLFNQVASNAPGGIKTPAPTLTARGSLHYATDVRQEETQNLAVNRVVFTSESEVQDFNLMDTQCLYIGKFERIRFAFSARQSFYRQAGLFHYTGDAVYPAMATQIIDYPQQLNQALIVSNSLPIWLGLNKFMPVYPSFLIPDDAVPPFGVAHIVPEETQSIQSAPYISSNGSHYQLAHDRVRFTTYGLRNDQALDFLDYVNEFTLDNDDVMGIQNIPTFRDDKQIQNELNTIAQRKTIEFEVDYYQTRVRDVARQLILSALPNFVIEGYEPVDRFPSFRFYEARNSFNLVML
jgi:hypothetical protein